MTTGKPKRSSQDNRSICVIQHVACETPGIIADALKSRGLELRFARPFRGERIPRRIGDYAGLLVMGGPMGVYEQTRHPFLRQEIRLIQDALSERRPILGICLGSQLLAAALDARVTRGKQKEIGWHPLTLGRAAARDALWRGLPESFVAYHWHGDVFELPRGATPLAWSKLTEHQAFRFGDSAYGLLFHLEVTEQIIRRMTRTFLGELREAGLNERQVLDGVAEHLPGLHTIGRAVFARWAALVKGERDARPDKLVIRTKRVYEPPAPANLVTPFTPTSSQQPSL
jgi:GMP synthase (glutamine-hydrolysing)